MAAVSSIRYLGVIYALSYGYFLFDERYDYLAISGMLLVVGGVLLNVLWKQRQKRKETSLELDNTSKHQ